MIDLERQNNALLMKNIDKFYNKKDIPWVSLIWEKHYQYGKLPNHIRRGSFWWRDILKILDEHKKVSKVKINNGATCLLWTDNRGNQPLKNQFPELFSFAPKKTS